MTSYVKCEDIRSIAKQRLSQTPRPRFAETLREVEDRLAILLGL